VKSPIFPGKPVNLSQFFRVFLAFHPTWSTPGPVEESPFAVLSNGLRADQALEQQLGPEPRIGLDFEPKEVWLGGSEDG